MSPSPPQDAIGLVVDNRYRLVARVGVGPSATVYLADDVRLRRRVALKLLAGSLGDEPAFMARFGAEMAGASALRHPHIETIHDWGADGAPFVVGEYLSRGSLRRLIDRGNTLSPAQALQVALAVARALAYAHERGVVHRDLHPGNLVFSEDGRVKITDFGLARAHAEAASTQPMGAQVTAVRYASPEQARGENIDGRADVYALALMIIEAVTGRVPFAADTALATLMGRLESAPEIPPELGELTGPLERATAVGATDRLDASGFVTALMAVADAFGEPEPLPLIDESPRPESPLGDTELPDDITVIVAPGDADRIVGAVTSGHVSAEVSGSSSPLESGSSAPALPGERLPTDAGAHPVDEGVDHPAGPGEDGAEPVGSKRPVWRRRERSGDAAGVEAPVAGTEDAIDDVHRDDGGPAGRTADGEGAGGSGADDDRARRNHRRWRIAWAVLAVVILVGGGAVGLLVWQAQRTPTHLIPSVTGLSPTVAADRLGALGFDVTTRHIRRDGTVAGQLLGVDPSVGTRAAEGDEVTLTISDGQTLVTIPRSLAGVSEASANATLSALGLVVAPPGKAYSEDVEDGRVISADPGVGTKAEKGSSVSLTVSKGPRPRVVPDVSGMSPEQAEAALRNLGLVPKVTRRLDTHIDKGGLIGLDPSTGTTVPRGATVTVVVSDGLLVAVPSLDGVSTVAEAIAALQNAGLVANNLSGSGSLSGTPVAFDPPAGTMVAKGSPVNIVVR